MSITSFCLLSAMFVYSNVAYDPVRVHILRVKSLVVGGQNLFVCDAL